MLVCSLIIYTTAYFFMDGPKGMRYEKDLLSGLLFIQPGTLSHMLHSPQGQLESSFWSLYVEVKFYLLIAALYFLIGRNRALIVIATIFLMYKARFFIPDDLNQSHSNSFIQVADWFLVVAIAKYLGWFVAGALFYIYYKQQKLIVLIAALMLAFLAATEGGFFSMPAIAPSMVIILFAASILNHHVRKICWYHLL
jgi:peptidoglycan/LPS O-acetylase OafA/YrhL